MSIGPGNSINCIWTLQSSRRYIYFKINTFGISPIFDHSGSSCTETGLIILAGNTKYCAESYEAFDKIEIFTKIDENLYETREKNLTVQFISSEYGDASDIR